MKRRWTAQEEKEFREFYPNNGWKATAEKFRCTKSATQNFASKLKLKVKQEVTMRLRSAVMSTKTTSDSRIDKFLKRNYLIMPVKTMAAKINRSHTFVNTRLRQLNLKIPRKIIDQRIKDSRLKPGHTPANKGKTWDQQGIPLATRKRMLKGAFKKGQTPKNAYDRDGIITLRTDTKTGRKYKYIRVALGVWKELHLHQWEKVNGKLPKGHCLWFIDGNSLNTELSNLELITRKENYRRNSAATNLSDAYVANTLVGGNRKSADKELTKEFASNHPDIIEAKRTHLLLTRKIKSIKNEKQTT